MIHSSVVDTTSVANVKAIELTTCSAIGFNGILVLAMPQGDGLKLETRDFSSRSTLDYLSQGRSFDSFNNKAVSHVEMYADVTQAVTGMPAGCDGFGLQKDFHFLLQPSVTVVPYTNDALPWPTYLISYGQTVEFLTQHRRMLYYGAGRYMFWSSGVHPCLHMVEVIFYKNSYDVAAWTVWGNTNSIQTTQDVRKLTIYRKPVDILTVDEWKYALNIALERCGWSAGSHEESARPLDQFRPKNFGNVTFRSAGLSLEDQWEHINHVQYWLYHYLPWDSIDISSVRGDACSQAVDDVNCFDGNMIAYLSDLPKVGSSILSIIDAARQCSVGTISSAYLSGRYGDRLTVKDSVELLKALIPPTSGRPLWSRGLQSSSFAYESEGCTIRMSYTCKAFLTLRNTCTDTLSETINQLLKWDMLPTLGNVWDIIPFSFCVDWFLGVGDTLEQVDTAVQGMLLTPVSQYICESYLSEFVYPDGFTCRVESFRRDYYDVVGSVPLLRPIAPRQPAVINAADGTALLIQSLY